MGGDGRACLHQPSQMASDWQLTHLCICSWAHFYTCADLCDRGYSRFDDILLDTFASAVSYLMLNGSACPIYIKCCKSLALSKRFWSDPIFPSSAGKVNESFDRQKIEDYPRLPTFVVPFLWSNFLNILGHILWSPAFATPRKLDSKMSATFFVQSNLFLGEGPNPGAPRQQHFLALGNYLLRARIAYPPTPYIPTGIISAPQC